MIISRLHLPEHLDLAGEADALVRRAEAADGVAPISEQYLIGFRDDSLDHRHVALLEDHHLVGLAAIEKNTAEMVIDPEHRGKGLGATLLAELGDASVWAHGDLPAAQHLASNVGANKTRELLVMRIDDAALRAAAQVEIPGGFQVLGLDQARERKELDIDEQWLRVNNEAFSWHPEQGGWDAERLRRAQDTEWFRADDVLFLLEADTLAGFHWVKRHGDLRAGAQGEVYVVGLADAYRGKKLGDPLVRLGLRRLADAGAHAVILYVESDNRQAVAAYERLGFQVSERHVVYSPAPSTQASS